jgi:hypothetical protein
MVHALSARVGAGFRLERRLFVRHREAELFDHRVEHVVYEVAEESVPDLEGDVAVSEVVGGAKERAVPVSRDQRNGLVRGDDPNHAPIRARHVVSATEDPASR